MRMKLSVPPESIDWVMELLMGETEAYKPNAKMGSQHEGTKHRKEYAKKYFMSTMMQVNSLHIFLNSDNIYPTCPHWMASSPVLVSSLESPSGLKTIYGCTEDQMNM